MWITGRKYWDFISYDDRLPEPLNMFVKRIERAEDWIGKILEPRIAEFSQECADLHGKLRAQAEGAGA